MELLYIFTLFSFIGVVGILIYIVFEKGMAQHKADSLEVLELKVASLQEYIYELEERMNINKTPLEERIKEKIIEMYEEGKELMVIENALNVPRAKIEMILKFYNMNVKKENI